MEKLWIFEINFQNGGATSGFLEAENEEEANGKIQELCNDVKQYDFYIIYLHKVIEDSRYRKDFDVCLF